MRRLTKEEFIQKAQKVHGDTYDYSLTNYVNTRTKLTIVCPNHGPFQQIADNHLKHGCPECGRHKNTPKGKSHYRTLDTESFIKKSIKIHGGTYDYSLVDYKKNNIAVSIGCSIHGVFEQTPQSHLSGSGCPECAGYKPPFESPQDFIERANLIHDNKFDYSLMVYRSYTEPVIIVCPEHGEFKQTPQIHMVAKHGCPECALNGLRAPRKTTKEFIREARGVHGDLYDYCESKYKGSTRKITIICPRHGRFRQTPHMHIQGQGCPRCRMSNGEQIIASTLNALGIEYESEKSFDGCKYKKKLLFDFYIPSLNTLIEFDGIHHFEPTTFTKSQSPEEYFRYTLKRDSIKNKFAKENGFILIRIPYYTKDIPKHLESQLSSMAKNFQ
jgi:very-short-patch-repair endonuclease